VKKNVKSKKKCYDGRLNAITTIQANLC